MILLILGAIAVCNFFLTIVNKFLVYMSINLIYIFFFSNTVVVSVNVFYRQASLYQHFSVGCFYYPLHIMNGLVILRQQ